MSIFRVENFRQLAALNESLLATLERWPDGLTIQEVTRTLLLYVAVSASVCIISTAVCVIICIFTIVFM